jgi:hypothetical protein
MIRLNDILESYPDEEFLKADGFDDAIIGIDAMSNRLVYSVEAATEMLMMQGMMRDDALEHIFHKIIKSDSKSPIWINVTV